MPAGVCIWASVFPGHAVSVVAFHTGMPDLDGEGAGNIRPVLVAHILRGQGADVLLQLAFPVFDSQGAIVRGFIDDVQGGQGGGVDVPGRLAEGVYEVLSDLLLPAAGECLVILPVQVQGGELHIVVIVFGGRQFCFPDRLLPGGKDGRPEVRLQDPVEGDGARTLEAAVIVFPQQEAQAGDLHMASVPAHMDDAFAPGRHFDAQDGNSLRFLQEADHFVFGGWDHGHGLLSGRG